MKIFSTTYKHKDTIKQGRLFDFLLKLARLQNGKRHIVQ